MAVISVRVTCQPPLNHRLHTKLRILNCRTRHLGIGISKDISALKTFPRPGWSLVNTLVSTRVASLRLLDICEESLRLLHDGQQGCQQLKYPQPPLSVFWCLDHSWFNASAKNLKNSMVFEAPWIIFAYLTPSIPAKKFKVVLAVDK